MQIRPVGKKGDIHWVRTKTAKKETIWVTEGFRTSPSEQWPEGREITEANIVYSEDPIVLHKVLATYTHGGMSSGPDPAEMTQSDRIGLNAAIMKQLEEEAYSRSLETDRPIQTPSPTSETGMKDIPPGGFF